jgi:hypothetical protein
MMPSVSKLVNLLQPDRLLYIGLSDTQLTSQMFEEIMLLLASKPRYTHQNQAKLPLRLEIQPTDAYPWLTEELYDAATQGAQSRGIEVKCRKPTPQSVSQRFRENRKERRDQLKAVTSD